MEGLGENVKKLLLAGVGAAATTVEKSKEILDDLVEKGELTVEQGKALNEELKHNIKKTVEENVKNTEKADPVEELDKLSEQPPTGDASIHHNTAWAEYPNVTT